MASKDSKTKESCIQLNAIHLEMMTNVMNA